MPRPTFQMLRWPVFWRSFGVLPIREQQLGVTASSAYFASVERQQQRSPQQRHQQQPPPHQHDESDNGDDASCISAISSLELERFRNRPPSEILSDEERSSVSAASHRSSAFSVTVSSPQPVVQQQQQHQQHQLPAASTSAPPPLSQRSFAGGRVRHDRDVRTFASFPATMPTVVTQRPPADAMPITFDFGCSVDRSEFGRGVSTQQQPPPPPPQ